MIFLVQDKKAAQEKERENRIAEAEVQNLQGARHQEGLALAQKLAQKQLQIKEISSDGHCLYRAVADQLAQRSEVGELLCADPLLLSSDCDGGICSSFFCFTAAWFSREREGPAFPDSRAHEEPR